MTKRKKSELEAGVGELYRVRHGGQEDEELVTAESPQGAAARFTQARGAGSGIICVREPGGKEHRYFVRRRKAAVQ